MDNRKRNVRALREKVERYRVLARLISDPETQRRILELTNELEQQVFNSMRGQRNGHKDNEGATVAPCDRRAAWSLSAPEIGTDRLQTSPPDANSTFALPPNVCRAAVIKRDPNPVRVGGVTGGPPLSFH